jgi:hypothetical protein
LTRWPVSRKRTKFHLSRALHPGHTTSHQIATAAACAKHATGGSFCLPVNFYKFSDQLLPPPNFLSPPGANNPFSPFSALAVEEEAAITAIPSDNHAIPPIPCTMSDRISFGKLHEAIQPPNLIELQIKSYEEFFQTGVDPSKRKNVGLQAVFREFFPIFWLRRKIKPRFRQLSLGGT